MHYQCALLAVEDVERSKEFYGSLFGQTVALDLGLNVTFSGGFAIQQGFGALVGIEEGGVLRRPNNMELYFETDDFDGFVEKLASRDGIEYLNRPMTHPWLQRVVRIYDPDGHIIEIGEEMAFIARRLLKEGRSAEETSRLIQHPVAFVEAARDGGI